MPINFPDSPTTGDTHTIGDKTWTYDGTAWNVVTSSGSDHGNLGGLADDDHTQYLLADGTRTATELTVGGDLTVDTSTLHVDSTNNRVGIGTSTPTVPLDVVGDTFVASASGDDYLNVDVEADDTHFRTRLSRSLSMDGQSVDLSAYDSSTYTALPLNIDGDPVSINNLRGVGAVDFTLADSVTLDGSITDYGTSIALNSGDNQLLSQLTTDGSTWGEVRAWNTNTESGIELYVTGSTVYVGNDMDAGSGTMFVDSSTNRVGIGTTSPSQTLDVRGIARVGDDVNRTPDANGVGHLMIDGNGYGGFVSLDGTAMWVGHNSAGRNLNFAIDETARMTLDTSGRLGIGTTSPSKPLHIVYDDPTIQLTDTNTNADSIISANSSVGSLILGADENNEVGSSQIAFKVDGVTRMGLQATGNLEMLGGTVKGDGALVQMVAGYSGASDLTSSANIASITMSPKYSDSTMLVFVNYHVYKYNSTQGVNNQYQLYQSGGGNITALHNYVVYDTPSYMFQGMVSGTIAAGSTASRTYHFYVTASSASDRIYFYWKRMYVLEIAT